MLRPTFAGIQTARSGLRVSQNLLDITGQNITNVNTEGYTRQRVDISSIAVDNSDVKFANKDLSIGYGVKADGTSQYRDAFLDSRYREQAAKSGSGNVQLEALNELTDVFDEIETDGLDAQFSDLVSKLQSLASYPSDPVIESTVRTSASMLCQMFNHYSDQINTIKEEQVDYLKNEAVKDVNSIMKRIAELNDEIRKDNISGNPALELNDKRNTLIDELSSYADIKVTLTSEDIGCGKTVDTLSISLNGSGLKLVDGKNYAELGVTGDSTYLTTGSIGVALTKSIDATTAGTDITDSLTNGEIGGYLRLLNGQGSYGSTAQTQVTGLQYYEKLLDTAASKFASLMNDLNKTTNPSGTVEGLLFVSADDAAEDGTGITAANIKISTAWKNSTSSYIKNTKTTSTTGDTTGSNDNITKMIALFKNDTDFTTGSSGFKGTLQEYISNISSTLDLHVEDTQGSVDTSGDTLSSIDELRQATSSVDLDEEGVGLIVYQKSYNAAARLMTVLDEMLDTLINGMAV